MGYSAYFTDNIMTLWMSCEVSACVVPWAEVKLALVVSGSTSSSGRTDQVRLQE